MRFPLQGAVSIETSYISFDDRFAAQIVYATGRNAPAPEASGRLSAQHELRSSRKGPRPPMVRLLSCQVSFHFSFRIEVVYTGITKSPYCGNCRSWDISFIPSVLD